MKAIIAGLQRLKQRSLEGAAQGLAIEAAALTAEMRANPAHGDQSGASHANYSARVVGLGRTGASELQEAREAGGEKNPGRVAPTQAVAIAGPLGVILDDQMEYGPVREQAFAGEKAVIGPTIRSAGDRLTAAAAEGSRKALS